MPSTSNNEQLSKQNRRTLKEVAMVCKRYGISDRTGTAVATATFKAFGIVTENESKFAIDRSQLKREQSKDTKEIRLEEDHFFGLETLFKQTEEKTLQ